MGYTTDFYGSLALDKPMAEMHREYLDAFRNTRRMKRNASIAETLADPVRLSVGLPIGVDGEYFVNGFGSYGQDSDVSVVDQNTPPANQPGLWCQWAITDDGKYLEWDGGEKFYYYVDWLNYLIERFIKPWGYTLSGEIEWQGEDRDDFGLIQVENNVVTVKSGSRVYE